MGSLIDEELFEFGLLSADRGIKDGHLMAPFHVGILGLKSVLALRGRFAVPVFAALSRFNTFRALF
jgi:hypothetical protein